MRQSEPIAARVLPPAAVPRPWRAEARATLALAWPMVGTQLGVIVMMNTDVIMLGWLSPQALAASALGSGVYYVFWLFCMGLAMGGAPMMAQAVGRRRHMVRDIRRSLRQSWWTVLAAAVPCLVMLQATEPVLLAIGQPAPTVRDAVAYIDALSFGFVPALWYICLRNFVSALERPRSAFVVTVVAIFVNAAIAYALIFGEFGFPQLGVVGAGVATAVSSLFSFLAMVAVVQIDRQFRRFHLLGRFWRPDWPRFFELMRIGIPIGLAMLFEVGLFSTGSSLLMGWLGPAELAASYIVLQVASATFMVPMGIGQAACVRAGIFAGAGNNDGVRRAGWTALALGVGFMALAALTMWTVPESIVSLYLGDIDSAERRAVAVLAISYLSIAALFQIFDAAQVIAAGVLRGLKDTQVPMWFAAFGYWAVGLPACVLLAYGVDWRGQGVWYGFVISLMLMAGLMVGRFMRLAGRPA